MQPLQLSAYSFWHGTSLLLARTIRVVTTSRGGSFYDEAQVHARYTADHDNSVSSPNFVMEEPAVLAEVGDPGGLRVLDVGCGDARFGRWLLSAGARSYRGIDGSRRMVELASRTLTGTAGRVERGDLEDLAADRSSVDLVTARLVLHYVADLDGVLAAIINALAPGGRLIITVVHPVITSHDNRLDGPRTSWTVDDYFLSGARQRLWMGSEVTWQHRTVETYVDAVIRAGLTVTAVRECAPEPARFNGNTSELARRRRVPLFLLLSARAPGHTPTSLPAHAPR
jgi:SAM-dependent methyltransferase